MRFLLTLSRKRGNILPLNYQYELSSWIYKVINQADSDFAGWLHEQGYTLGGKKFKLFCFSRLMVPQFKILGDRMKIEADRVQLLISFGLEASAEKFIMGIFQQQQFGLGDKISRVDFEVVQIEAQESGIYSNEVRFRTLSPICVSKAENRNGRPFPIYLSPEDEEYERIFFNNLINKYEAVNKSRMIPAGAIVEENPLMQLKLLNTPKSRLVTIKAGTDAETKVRGFDYEFGITAPVELLELGYNCGFGEKNSEGFGMVEVR